MEKILQSIRLIYSEQTQKTSDICRQIVFALLAVVWAFIFQETKQVQGVNEQIILVALFSLIAYLVIDIIQYFISALLFRKQFNDVKSVYSNLESNDLDGNKISERSQKYGNFSFYCFICKIIVLLFSCVIILVAVIKIL